MPDETPTPPRPPAPPTPPKSDKTTTVPLKKETVRITLKAKPDGAPPAPPAPKPPGAPKPPTAIAPKAPSAPRPPTASAPQVSGGAPKSPGLNAPVAGRKTAALPKATVKLQPTPAIPQAPTLSGISTTSVIDDDDDDEAALVPFAILAFVISVVLLGIQLLNFLQAQ